MTSQVHPGPLTRYALEKNLFNNHADPRMYGALRPIPKRIIHKDGIYLPQISSTDTDETLTALLKKEGLVPKEIITNRNSSTTRTIDFNSEQDATKALELFRKEGYKVKQKQGPAVDEYNVYIKGLPQGVTENGLKDFLKDIQIPEDSIRSVHVDNKGSFVRFKEVKMADKAIQLINGKPFSDQTEEPLIAKKANAKHVNQRPQNRPPAPAVRNFQNVQNGQHFPQHQIPGMANQLPHFTPVRVQYDSAQNYPRPHQYVQQSAAPNAHLCFQQPSLASGNGTFMINPQATMVYQNAMFPQLPQMQPQASYAQYPPYPLVQALNAYQVNGQN